MPKNSYKCPTCGRWFLSKSRMEHHLNHKDRLCKKPFLITKEE